MPLPSPQPIVPGMPDRTALQVIRTEAFAGELFVSLSGSTFLTGLALFLGAGPLFLGLLIALPFIAQVAQLIAPLLERHLHSRRRFVVPAFAIGRLLWLIPGALALFAVRGTAGIALAMIATFLVAWSCMVGVNGWTAWMADLVPAEQRARVFASRSAAVALATMIALPAGTAWLDYCRHLHREGLGHAVLAAIAATSGVIAATTLSRLPDAAPMPHPDHEAISLTRRLFQRRRFRQVVALFSAWNLSIGLPAAFFTLYMLRNLGMSYFLVGLHASIILAMRMLTHRTWARAIERTGSLRVLIASAFGVALVPLLWMLPTRDALWPIWAEAVYAGIFWTGFNQAAFLQPIAVLAPPERSHGLALYNVCTGTAMFVASMLGGVFLHALGTADATGFFFLFGTATAIRVFVAMLALRLTEPSMSVHGFLSHFVGFGMREVQVGRDLSPGHRTPVATVPVRRRPGRKSARG
jgi:MFS family permease